MIPGKIIKTPSNSSHSFFLFISTDIILFIKAIRFN
jgi:hypothetical protein